MSLQPFLPGPPLATTVALGCYAGLRKSDVAVTPPAARRKLDMVLDQGNKTGRCNRAFRPVDPTENMPPVPWTLLS